MSERNDDRTDDEEDEFTAVDAAICFTGAFLMTYGLIRGMIWLGKRKQGK